MVKDANKEYLIEQILNSADEAFHEWFYQVPTEIINVNLTMPQFRIVLLLYFDGTSRMSFIASQLGVSLATATGIVDRLVEQELVVREAQPKDRRVVLCHLSEKGEKLMNRVLQVGKEHIAEILSTCDIPQLKQIDKVLKDFLVATRIIGVSRKISRSTAKLTLSS